MRAGGNEGAGEVDSQGGPQLFRRLHPDQSSDFLSPGNHDEGWRLTDPVAGRQVRLDGKIDMPDRDPAPFEFRQHRLHRPARSAVGGGELDQHRIGSHRCRLRCEPSQTGHERKQRER